MPVTCDPKQLAAEAKCFLECTTPGMRAAINTMLLARIAGGSTDPKVLANEARCFLECIPPGMQKAVQAYLLCQIVNKP